MTLQSKSLLVASLVFFFSSLGQARDNVSLYQLSLRAYVEAKAEQGGTADSIVVWDTDVLHDKYAVETFPQKIGSITIEYLTTKSIMERYKRLGKAFSIVEILPMRNYHDLLVVRCAEYSAGVRHGRLDLGVFGGYKVTWRFDSSKDEYVKINVERWLGLVM